MPHEADRFHLHKRSSVGEALARHSQSDRKRLREFATTGHGDTKRLKGRDGMRLRVGDWRVIFYEDQGAIIVAAVGHRRDIYD
jgi:mRNA interferase RelE/StbE